MLDFSQFQLISFDCYGTLVDWEAGILGALKPLLSRYDKVIADGEILSLFGEFEARFEQGGYLPYRQVLSAVAESFASRLNFRPAAGELSCLADSLADWAPFPDTQEALQKLKTRYKLAVISNIDNDLFAQTAPKLGVEFDYLITAQAVQAYKPALAIFKAASQRFGVAPASWLHVGQSVYHDVLPARSMGCASVWINRASARPDLGPVKAAAGKPDLELPDLRSLSKIALGE